MPTLILSTENLSRERILTFDPCFGDGAIDKFLKKVFNRKLPKENLKFVNGRYHYTPSQEYRLFKLNFSIRMNKKRNPNKY